MTSNKLFYPISAILVLWLVINSVLHLSSSLDWDELDVASKLANKEYLLKLTPDQEKSYGIRIPDVVDPRKNVRNHFISTVSGLGLSEIFGVNKYSLRAPSVLWTLLLAVTLIAAQGLIGRGVVLFALAHLSLNGLCLWYFHSMRGYASVLLLSTALFLLGLKWVEKGLSRREKVFFLVLGFLTPLAHAFGAIFFLLLLPVIAFSLYVRGKSAVLKEMLPCLLPVAFIGYMFVSQFLFISRVGYLLAKKAPGISEPLLAVFGVRENLMMLVIAIGLVALGAFQVADRDRRFDFRFLTAAACWIFVTVALTVLKTSFFEPRFVLPFLVPSVIWVAHEALSRRWFAETAFACLFLFPFAEQDKSIAAVQGQMKAFDDFVVRVQALSPAGSCYLVSGETDQVYFSNSLYLKNQAPCRSRFHVHFGKNWSGTIPLVKEPNQFYQLKIRDNDGREMYELQPQLHVALSASKL